MDQTIIFDTHRYVKRLTDAGLAPPIAEVLADEQAQLLDRNLSTKEDIARLETTLETTLTEIKAEIIAKNLETKVELIKWNVGAMLVFGGLLVTALKFL